MALVVEWDGERDFSLMLSSNHCLTPLFWKTTSAETKCPHEAAYDAFLCGSGNMFLRRAVCLLW